MDNQILDGQGTQVISSNFFHEQGKVMLHAGSLTQHLAEKTLLSEKSTEEAESLMEKLKELKLDKGKLLAENDQLAKTNSKLLTDVASLKLEKDKLLAENNQLAKTKSKLPTDVASYARELRTTEVHQKKEIAIYKELEELIKTGLQELYDEFRRVNEYKQEFIGLFSEYLRNGFKERLNKKCR